MKIKKKTIVITAASIGVLGIGAWYLGQNLRSSQVDVYPVSDLSQSIWQNGTSLDGTIASQVSQEVHLQDKQIVSAVHVQEGQEVKKGDPLLSYDMTLVNIDLEMEKLTRQQLEIKKKGLEQELEKLKKDKAQAVSRTEEYQVEFLGSIQDTDLAAVQTAAEQGLEQPAGESGEGELPADQENLFQEDGAGETDGVSDQENPSGSGDTTGSGETPDSEEPEGTLNPETPKGRNVKSRNTYRTGRNIKSGNTQRSGRIVRPGNTYRSRRIVRPGNTYRSRRIVRSGNACRPGRRIRSREPCRSGITSAARRRDTRDSQTFRGLSAAV